MEFEVPGSVFSIRYFYQEVLKRCHLVSKKAQNVLFCLLSRDIEKGNHHLLAGRCFMETEKKYGIPGIGKCLGKKLFLQCF